MRTPATIVSTNFGYDLCDLLLSYNVKIINGTNRLMLMESDGMLSNSERVHEESLLREVKAKIELIQSVLESDRYVESTLRIINREFSYMHLNALVVLYRERFVIPERQRTKKFNVGKSLLPNETKAINNAHKSNNVAFFLHEKYPIQFKNIYNV